MRIRVSNEDVNYFNISLTVKQMLYVLNVST